MGIESEDTGIRLRSIDKVVLSNETHSRLLDHRRALITDMAASLVQSVAHQTVSMRAGGSC